MPAKNIGTNNIAIRSQPLKNASVPAGRNISTPTKTNRKLRGRYYVKRKLMAKGYRSSAIDRITDLLVERGEIDFDANFKHLAQKKGADDENAIMTLKYKYGYKI